MDRIVSCGRIRVPTSCWYSISYLLDVLAVSYVQYVASFHITSERRLLGTRLYMNECTCSQYETVHGRLIYDSVEFISPWCVGGNGDVGIYVSDPGTQKS